MEYFIWADQDWIRHGLHQDWAHLSDHGLCEGTDVWEVSHKHREVHTEENQINQTYGYSNVTLKTKVALPGVTRWDS